jgi:hypothetical protein
MTNAQNATWHAVKDIIAKMPLEASQPVPLHEGTHASVVFELQERNLDVPRKFLIEAGGCLTRILM